MNGKLRGRVRKKEEKKGGFERMTRNQLEEKIEKAIFAFKDGSSS